MPHRAHLWHPIASPEAKDFTACVGSRGIVLFGAVVGAFAITASECSRLWWVQGIPRAAHKQGRPLRRSDVVVASEDGVGDCSECGLRITSQPAIRSIRRA